MLILLGACIFEGHTLPAATVGAPVVGPAVVGALEVEPAAADIYGAARLVFATDVPTRAYVELAGPAVVTADDEVLALEHELALVGLLPGGFFEGTVTLVDELGATSVVPIGPIASAAFPGPLPDLEVLAWEPSRVEPGWTLLDATSTGPGDLEDYWLLVLDEELRFVWGHHTKWEQARVTAQGTLLGLRGSRVVEMDWLGDPLGDELFVAGLHHDSFPAEDGTIWALSDTTLQVPDYPVSYADPTGPRAPATLTVTTVVHLDPDRGVLGEWLYSDALDPRHIGFGSLARGSLGHADWSHGNSVTVDPADGGVLASARHLDAVIRWSADGALEWVLGDPAGWPPEMERYLLTPVGEPFRWPYHMHAVSITADGGVAMFDNGNFGHTPYTPPPPDTPWSRGVIYDVDPVRMEIRQRAEFEQTATGSLYGHAKGSTQVLPITGNALVHFGMLEAQGGTRHVDLGLGRDATRVVEWAPDQPLAPVLDLRLSGSLGEAPGGWHGYRAQRFPRP